MTGTNIEITERKPISKKVFFDLLNALDCDTVYLDELRDFIAHLKDNKILSQHHYAITENKDGRFSTYLPDETKPNHRRKICKSSKEALEKAVIKFYKECEEKQLTRNITLRQFYPEWFKYKSLHTNSSAYMRTIDELRKNIMTKTPLLTVLWWSLTNVLWILGRIP